ncbi:ABC transporter ATP-binding protein [Lapidilactobacillus wuchangensis]|uniref:ABC transporter ATP-binding protein n=1 Tax=Lapidilactobacillus wuchangensis TaxID=2486001 RepID=UPI000F7A5BBE|nr:ATP-binding cassette domain-containing protein [Lapidilactobacillus wuchangensis]
MAILTLKNVSYTVDQQQIIPDLNLTVAANDFLTITGPSGCGKSTLLKLIASLATPTSGEIIFAGKNQLDYERPLYRQQVSYCFQQPTLFDQTVRDNLQLPFEIRQQDFDQARVTNYLELVALPANFIDKKITDLSGGERQRVALIRNLIFPPKILLLDEVTAGLDSRSKEIVQDLIRQLTQDKITLIQVTHDSDELKTAANIIHMKQGGIIDETISR